MKKINGKFFNQDIISVEQFSKGDIETVFQLANFYKKGVEQGSVFNDLKGKILTALFYEPSSRTFGSFVASIQRLGGGIIPLQGVTYSSVSKGETLEDTVRTFESYSDCIVMRHSEKGAAKRASSVLSIPLINAGDGTGEHPTQGLLDLFTIKDKLGRTNNMKVAFVGDLKYGRTAHSLSKLISIYPKTTLYFIAPPLSPMPDEVVKIVKKNGATVKTAKSIEEVLKTVDVLYMTRVQKERMEKSVYEKIKNAYILTGKMARTMKKDSLIMHPLPRVGEITEDVDSNPRAMYLKHQMRNGMFIRMALLRLILKK